MPSQMVFFGNLVVSAFPGLLFLGVRGLGGTGGFFFEGNGGRGWGLTASPVDDEM